MVPGDPRRMALHRSRQADAKRLRRKLQRQLPRRVPQRDSVLVARPGTCHHHGMEGGLQQKQTALIAGQYHAQRVRNENGYGKTGRMRPDYKPKTLLKTGGKLGLRSQPEARLMLALYPCPNTTASI